MVSGPTTFPDSRDLIPQERLTLERVASAGRLATFAVRVCANPARCTMLAQ
jgi:hypothetical protein